MYPVYNLQGIKKEVIANKAISAANRKRISPRKVIEYAIEECPRLPKPIKRIINDKLFYKSCKHKTVSP